jgi:hypothetical protein
MIRVEMLPARMGDCLWIEYGENGQRHRVMIDGGTSGTAADVKARLAGIPEPAIDLIVVTHIDNDHIGGVLKYLTTEPLPSQVGEVWFNGFRHLPQTPVESMGPGQGERLTDRLIEPDLKEKWNYRFDHEAVSVPPVGGLPTKTLPGGLKLTVLTPGPGRLADLRDEWEKVVEEGEPEEEPAEPALPPGVEVMGGALPPLPDVEKLAEEDFTTALTEANGSSIALLAEYQETRMLFTGDAEAEDLMAALDRLVGKDQPIDVDVFQVPHHGSRHNLSPDLAARVNTPAYLISSSGSVYHHPHKEAVARILKRGPSPHKTLYFNYRQTYNEIWGDDRLTTKYGYVARYPTAGGVIVDV